MTNGSVEITEGCLKRSGLDKQVSNMWDINQAGFFKPHPRVYKYVLEQLGLEPEQVSPPFLRVPKVGRGFSLATSHASKSVSDCYDSRSHLCCLQKDPECRVITAVIGIVCNVCHRVSAEKHFLSDDLLWLP
jgi:hypothetical protein